MGRYRPSRRQWTIGATVLVAICGGLLVRAFWASGAQDRAAQTAVDLINQQDWAALYDLALLDEVKMMECEKTGFVNLMSQLYERAGIRLEEPALYAEPGSRPVASYAVTVIDQKGNLHPNTLAIFVGKAESGYRISIGDLAFQLALLSPAGVREDLAFLSHALSDADIARLLNPREMIVTDVGKIDQLLVQTPENQIPNPGAAWRKLQGF